MVGRALECAYYRCSMEKPFDTTCDAFLDGRIHVRQPAKGFRSGLDAVFLAAACPAASGTSVLEAGCGAGAASLCLLARVDAIKVTGIEADSALAALARQNAAASGFGENFGIVAADLTDSWSRLETLGLRREAYDHAIANPPFYVQGRGRLSKDGRNARSRAMQEEGLNHWLRFLSAAVKPGGTATVIHTAEALPQLLNAFEGRFGALRIIPLHPKSSALAIRVIMCGIKGSRAPLTLAPGIVLHEDDGAPSKAAKAILRDGRRLP
jgi:tRNA1(Val) A37 N6-methylase TrmN6